MIIWNRVNAQILIVVFLLAFFQLLADAIKQSILLRVLPQLHLIGFRILLTIFMFGLSHFNGNKAFAHGGDGGVAARPLLLLFFWLVRKELQLLMQLIVLALAGLAHGLLVERTQIIVMVRCVVRICGVLTHRHIFQTELSNPIS